MKLPPFLTILSFPCLYIAFTLTSCMNTINGNGQVTSQTQSVGSFDEITVEGSMQVFIKQGPVEDAKIEAESNIIPFVELQRDGDELVVKFKNNTRISTHQPVLIYLTAPQVNDLKLLGSGNIRIQDSLINNNEIKTKIAGSGDIHLKMNAPELESDIVGSGNVIAEGETKDIQIKIAGSGDFKGGNLKSENADIKILGSGNAYIFSSIQLQAKIMGSGNIYYAGNPTLKTTIAGSGKVIKQN